MKVFLSFIFSLFFISGAYTQSISPTGPVAFCVSGNLTVINAPGNPTYQWQLNGGDIPDANLVTYSATVSGNYTVVLDKGLPTEVTLGPVVVTINPAPTASFTFNPNNVCANTPIQFNNNSSGTGLTYSWDFGDPASGGNNSSTTINPVHAFIGSAGIGTQTFTVTLTATSNNGCSNITTSTVTIGQRPGTELNGTGATTINGQPYFKICSFSSSSLFNFINISSTTPNTNYRIIWGDASPDFNQATFTTTTHTYNVGTYTLLFIVSGSNGCIDTGRYTVFAGSNPAVGLNNPGNTSICTGSTLTFPITNTSSNPPGTIYTVTFNDGSAPVVFSHPPPASVTHNFTSTSCGTTSSDGTNTYPNSFSAVIVASNPCGTSSSGVVPIYVSKKPTASFIITPKDTVCVNTIVTFTNNGTTGTTNDNGTCTNGKQIWTVTPAAGWTINSGSLGNDFGFNDPSLWVTGTTVLSLNFNTPGIYTIKLKVGGNLLCGADSIVKTICVNPAASASFNLDQNTGCAPLTVTTTNTSLAPNCGQNTYNWSVSYAPTAGCLPNTSGYTYINGTNATSINPQFQFTNPGVYTIILTTIAPAASCSSTVSKTVTVKGKPVVAMTAPSSVCVSQTINPSATYNCYINGSTTYAWSFPGGTPSSSTLPNPGTITYSTAGSYTITLAVTNECGTTTVSSPLTVSTSPSAVVPANIVVCPGATVGPLSFTSVPTGATFSWTNSNAAIGLAAGGSSNPIPAFTVVNATASPIVATISVTATLSGCSSANTFTITVNPSPTVNVVTNQTLCAGSPTVAITFTGNQAGAVYNWTNNNTSIGLAANGTGGIAPFSTINIGATAVTATVTVTPSFTSNGITCTGPPKIFTITVNPIPTINAVSDQTLCAGASTTVVSFSGTVAGTVFTWTNSNAGIGLVASGIGNIGSFIAINGSATPITATVTVTPSFTNSGITCSGSPIIFTITVNPSPTLNAIPNQTLCAGSLTAAITFTGNQAGAVYNWTNNNASIGLPGSGTGDITSFNVINGGVAPVTATIAVTPSFTSNGVTCTGPPKIFTITVNPIPTVNSVSDQTLCAGASTTAISFSGTVAATVFTWTNSNATIGLGASGTGNIGSFIAINGGATLVAATVTVTPTFTNSGVTCSGSPITFTITVNPSPTVNVVSNQTLCAGSNTAAITFSGNQAGAIYNWTNTNASIGLPASGTGDIASFGTINSGATVVTSTVTVTPSFTSNGITCTGTPKTFTITVNPKPSVPGQVAAICSGGTFIVTPANAPPTTIIPIGTTYSWSVPAVTGGITGGASGTNQPNITGTLINPTNTPQTATYTVTPTSGAGGNCIGADFTVTVTVNPQAIVQNETSVICSGNTFTITPSNATPGNSIPVGTLYTWINPVSAPPGAITGGGPQPIGQSSVSQTLTNTTNAPATLTYTVTPVVGGSCSGSSFSVTVTVNPKPVIPVQTASICSGGTFTVAPINAPPATIVPAGTTYSWSVPVVTGGITGGAAGTNQANIGGILTNPTNNAQTATYTVTPTSGVSGNCVGSTFTVTVTVNAKPSIADKVTTVCSGLLFNVAPVNGGGDIVPAGTTYSWSTPAITGGITGGAPGTNQTSISGTLTNPTNVVQTATYTVSPVVGGNCPGSSFTITVTVNPKPVIPLQTVSICSGGTFTVTLVNAPPSTIVPAGTTYSWSIPVVTGGITGGASGTNQANIGGILTNPTNTAQTATYTVTPTSGASGNCVGSTFTVTVTVNPKPSIADKVTTVCSGLLFNVAPANGGGDIVPAGTTYSWGIPIVTGGTTGGAAGTNQINISGTLTNPTNTVQTATYSVTPVVGGSCAGSSFTVTVSVSPMPSITDKAATVCSGLLFTVIPLNGGGDIVPAGTTYSWGIPAVTGGITGGATGTNQTSISGTLTNPTNTLQTATYTVIPSVAGNCPGISFTVTVTVNPKPQLISPLIPAPVCTNTPFTYTAVSSIGNTTFTWSRPVVPGISNPFASGNGPTINETLINTTTSPATVSYNFSMIDNGCTNIQTVSLVVNPNAKSQFVIDTNVGCAPYQINQHITVIRYINANDESQYQWFADGILIGTGLTVPAYSITQPADTVIIMLIAKSKFGCKDDTSSLTIYTLQRPLPSFTTDRDTACGPASIFFTNTTTPINVNNNSSYFWDFGNGTTSTAIQPGSIIFQPNPTYGDTVYLVKLKVTTSCDTITVTKPILIQSKPKALFTPDHTFGCSPFTAIFTNTSKGSNISYHWDFGDGTSLNINNNSPVSHIYNTGIRDTFYVVLTATNNCGIDSLRYALVVSPNTINLLFGVNGNELAGCAPQIVHFINNSSGATSFFWNFGDGSPIVSTTLNVDTVIHTYFQTGTFISSLRATNGCADTTSFLTIKVFQKPLPGFIADKYFVCLGDTVHFTNQTDTATSYLWQFGDGVTSTLINPRHTYSVPGLYKVILTAFRLYPSGSVCSDTVSRYINVVAVLPGHFNVSDSVGQCAPFSITFFNMNLPAVSTNWDFGDGTTGTGNTITHVYLHTGTFLVHLIVNDPGGCTYTSQRIVSVLGPDGILVYSGGFYCNSQQVRLEATISNTDSLVWNFGDGNVLITTQSIVYHTYAFAGIYVPRVTLKSNAGCQFLIQGLDTIKVDKISAGFAWSQQKFCGFTKIQFTDTSHAYFGLNNFTWNFGDGNTGNGNLVSHNYTASGNYTVRLIVNGNSNCSDTISHQLSIIINNKPVAAIQGDTSGCAFSAISFNGIIQSPDSINLISWTVSNGVTASGTPLIVNFSLPSIYNIRLVTGTVNGCFDTVYHTVKINPSPIVTTNNDMNLCLGNSAQLTATGASQYIWSPVQGLSCNNCSNPIASPTTTTTYVVRGLNAFGCDGYDTLVIHVIPPLKITVSANDSICIGQSVQLIASGASKYLWSPSIGLSSTNIPNPISTPASSIQYTVIGSDGFNCFADTGYVTVAVGQYPTVKLGQDLSLSTGTLYSFNPIIQNGPIRDWLWTPSTNLNCNTCPSPVATIKDNITYMVKVTTPFGCSAADTINIKVFCQDSQVFIPNAFTPDGDGLNDILMVRGSGILLVKSFRIFNRWGEIVFEKNNFPPNNPIYGWDGMVKGKKVPPDVFVYTAEVICDNGTPYIFKGNTTIIK